MPNISWFVLGLTDPRSLKFWVFDGNTEISEIESNKENLEISQIQVQAFGNRQKNL